MTKATKILSRIASISLFVFGVIGAVSGIWTMINGADFGAWIFPFVVFAVEIVLGNMLYVSTHNMKADRFLVLLIVSLLFLIFVRAIYGGKYLARSADIFAVFGMGVASVFQTIFLYYAIAVIVCLIVGATFRIIKIFLDKKDAE